MHVPGQGSLFTAKPEPLGDLLAGIHKHKIALPNFQRPWVWKPQMVYDLLISVAYRYPAGSLLTMPVTNATFALRSFEGSEALHAGDKPDLMILDGQQRLTSLYQALYQDGGVMVDRRVHHFYLDVKVLLSDPDGSVDVGDPVFDQALYFVTEERNTGRRIRYDGLTPLYELNTREQQLAAGALPLHYAFDPDGQLTTWKEDYIGALATDLAAYKELSHKWDVLVRPWLDRIRNYPFPVVELRADMPLSAICHIFEKVNSTGVPLDVFDLVTAVLWAKGYHLNESWDKTRLRFKEQHILPMQPQPLTGTHFIQSLSLVDSLARKRADPDGRVAVACRKQDLMALTRDTMEKWWAPVEAGYREASRFMSDKGILSERILPYSTLIIPLAAIFTDIRHRKGEAAMAATWPKVEQWYWCCVFSQRYSSQVEYAAAQDFEQVVGWVGGGDAPGVVRTFSFRADALQEITSIRNAIYKGILCLLARDGARDFGSGSKLTTNLFYETAQDHHHIFPTAALQQLGVSDPRSDTIVNKTLIGAAVNRSIGGRRPSQYIQTWRDNLGTDLFDSILRSHHIDPVILSSDNWDSFFRNRRDQLRQLIESACGGVMQSFAEDVYVEDVEAEEAMAILP